ncbi:DNA alkylation repair protein [Collimonas silvisoli]|uniref:DNA alkylation repair protein n=1 Tax=Collimonas silvisoli TaxID=2825884 RepID=UPI001B8CDBD8|nr:DNA alkylation repair protein [Collimonas silvisoli]
MSSVSPERIAELERGLGETTNLAECLAINQASLLEAVLPSLGFGDDVAHVVAVLRLVEGKGISHQLPAIGSALDQMLRGRKKASGGTVLKQLIQHPSDTVRSWAAFASIRAAIDIPLSERLESARPFAADSHFGVREWAWMAVRPYIAEDVIEAVKLLVPWTAEQDPNVRRFAVESTRPCGVWSKHIGLLKSNPSVAEPLLEPLKTDPSRYVQDSVANWLNDASKTTPKWVKDLCERWEGSGNATTLRITKKAMRSLRKVAG